MSALILSLGSTSAFAKYANSFLSFEVKTAKTFTEQNINLKVYPASLTKILTAHIILRDTQELTDTTEITKTAWGYKFKNSSRTFLEPGMRVDIDSLLKGLLIQSGNDAATALAEYHSGSVKEFVKEMNKTAKDIGMDNSNFANPHGRHDKNHYTTASDFKKLIEHTLALTPTILEYTTLRKFTFNEITQYNRNRTLREDGAVGLKTGFTPQSGYNLSACYSVNNAMFCTLNFGETTPNKRTQKSLDALNKFKQTYQVTTIPKGKGYYQINGIRYQFTHEAETNILHSNADTVKTTPKLLNAYCTRDCDALISVSDGTQTTTINAKATANFIAIN
ncbi:D-alanyl-D-alanine carboxypeptidase family protein [Thalassotalea maritima]|uniref:D-alanyl-D-alanine carboxypeptidase family protein n=1 Tax=Thalassotalea maritima TaxID=3242416 RepID=UPI003529876C